MKGIEFCSRSGNKYFYDDLTGLIFNINKDIKMEKIKKLHISLKIQNNLDIK